MIDRTVSPEAEANIGREIYIGDGVYVSLDPANMIKMRADHQVIFLEPDVYRELVLFARGVWPNLKL